MTTDQEVGESTSDRTAGPIKVSPGPAWIVAATVAGAVLVAWFFFAWLALDRHFIDAAGESVGTAFALLLAVSVVGALRAGQRR